MTALPRFGETEANTTPPATPAHGHPAEQDVREALFNECLVGPITKVQLPAERVTSLHGILFDVDPKLLIPGNAIFPPAENPRAFYEAIRPVLERHTLARCAEVRMSGTGLHLILWLRPAAELRSSAEQKRWGAIVRAVQCTLPVDPDMPGITAVTRPVGSINGKNGAVVEMLHNGEAVDPKAVEDYMRKLVAAPFKTVVPALLGGERVYPCPVCQGDGTRLDVLDRVGRCYGSCGNITLARLYDTIFQPRPTATKRSRAKKAQSENNEDSSVNEAGLESASRESGKTDRGNNLSTHG